MQFSTKEKTYGISQQAGNTGIQTLAGNLAVNTSYQGQNTYAIRSPDRRQGGEVKRTNLMDTPKNEEILNSFPQLNINRVDSAEHREKLKVTPPPGTSYIGLTNSMIDRPINRGDSRTTSTSVEKAGSNVYLNPRGDMYSSSQYGPNKTYGSNYPTYKRQVVNYNYAEKSDDGSDNEIPTYMRPTKMTMQRMDMEINPKMVSSVISRESNGGKQSGSRNKDSRKSGDDQPYEQLYASRHPNQSIRKSTIQISKAISSNAITQLQRVNENQKKQIKLLQKQLEDIKSSIKKYQQIKHRHQLDLQGKSRQIFDLERANKRLSEQLQGIRSYRTMDTVEQVIIVRLKEEIMQLNKKIIEMQAEHYKNQKMFLEKHNKKDGSKPTTEVEIDKESIKKLQETIIMSKRQSELLSAELQKQKEKSWGLQREKQQYIAKQSIEKQSNERELHSLRKQVTSLKSDLQKQIESLRLKDLTLDEKLKEQQKTFDIDLSKKLTQKEQEYKVRLNEEMRLYESKIVEQGKNDKVKQNEQRQQIENLRKQKQQTQNQLKQKIAEVEQNLQRANQKIAQTSIAASSQFTGEINSLKKIIEEKQSYIRGKENERNQIIEDIRKRDAQIDRLQKQSTKWKQEETANIEKNVRSQLEQQISRKTKQLSDKAAIIISLEQSMNQMKVKFEQEKQQQAVQLQAEIKQKEQKLQNEAKDKQQGAIKELEVTRVKLTEEVKRAESNLANITKELANVTSQKTKIEETVSVKQRQLKEVQIKFVDIQTQVQARSAEIAQIDNQKKVLAAEAQKLKQQSQKQKSSLKQFETKLATATSQLNTFKAQYAKIQQKSKQNEIQLNRATENVNTWKSKSENLQTTLDKERADFKVKIAQAEGAKVKIQIVKKYEQLLPEYEMLKERLKIKQQQISNREKAFAKIRHQTENEEGKVSGLMKQIKGLTAKVTETDTKLRTILSKVQADQNKYKELLDKFSTDSQVYLAFIKKLQEDNELIAQKYWKVRKLVKKQKITDEHELLEKHDYGTFKKYMQHEVMSHFKKVVIPAFQAKILHRISAHESNLLGKTKRLGQLRAMVQYSKKRRQAQIKG